MSFYRKICGMCGEEKSWTNFCKNEEVHTLLFSYCNECLSKYNRARYLKNKDKIIKRLHARRLKQKQDKIDAQRLAEEALKKPKRQKKVSLKEFRDVVKNKPISISDLID